MNSPHTLTFECPPYFQAAYDRVVRQAWQAQSAAEEALTEKQIVVALYQALKCGDFQRYVNTNGGQLVVYIPFAREQELMGRIRELEAQLAAKENPLVKGEFNDV